MLLINSDSIGNALSPKLAQLIKMQLDLLDKGHSCVLQIKDFKLPVLNYRRVRCSIILSFFVLFRLNYTGNTRHKPAEILLNLQEGDIIMAQSSTE